MSPPSQLSTLPLLGPWTLVSCLSSRGLGPYQKKEGGWRSILITWVVTTSLLPATVELEGSRVTFGTIGHLAGWWENHKRRIATLMLVICWDLLSSSLFLLTPRAF